MASLTALKRQPAEQLAAEALKASILSGDLKLGERLTEVDLASQLAVSRGTVRTALHELSRDGLVVLKPYAGWSVATIDEKDVWEIYTLRGSLERLAASLAAKKIDEAGRKRLIKARDAFYSACERSDRSAAIELDFALHHSIVDLSANGRLASHYLMVEQQIRLFINSTYRPAPNVAVAIAHHAPIIDAILAGDSETAARLSEEHVMSEGDRITGLVAANAAGE